MADLSVYIIAYNEEEKIADAVNSVLWADEVIVADSSSSDRTAEIASALGARVVQLEFTGFGKLRNDAIASCTHEWIFSLDADERCTAEAAEEIRRIINADDSADAYFTPRKNWFMGRWIRHCGWYPDYRQPQLFRRGALLFETGDKVHESYRVNGTTAHMQAAIWQFPFRNMAQALDKANRYSSLGVDRLEAKGARAGMGHALLRGLWSFFRIYILKLGFLDGWAGFVIAFSNLEGVFYRYAKLCERKYGWDRPPQS
ncbi:glycosyltransferase family 2 protein [Mariprofundus erugo]|uniref:Glycosyltransferase family 2 protein n=1 Tax=Mariprofundus erugo TaxID=2528639 RepID=A0A5R9GSE8_9PROT|nr:glycosyltransferase family 2 protein [Mariprofundus erugo]TLS67333.1 glycosyltransferase family 2 protein [Mariprofundus erugo]